MRKDFAIGSRKIGDGHPLFIIAECGITCNYDLDITKKLIDVTAEAGADAIKFIFWFPDEIMCDKTVTTTYQTVRGPEVVNMYDRFNSLRFTLDEWKEVKTYADKKGVIVFSTVNSPSGIEYAEALKLDAYKLSSWDYNDLPLWKKVAEIGKPMLIDTGPVFTEDVAKVMKIMKDAGNDQSLLLHCFHTGIPAEMNMRAIPYMRETFDTLVGFSATDTDDTMDIVAVSLGACVLEKRITLDRSLPGHHHVLSKLPDEFSKYVRAMRDVHASLGTFGLNPSANDLKERKKHFRHLVANTDLKAGTVLTADMLASKRGEYDVSPEHIGKFIGATLKRDLKENESILLTDV
ncbi:N-acetylneuraminate synthase family protein [Candidatus Peregrinibacteria bacterium]|nr:N-acetylneuraminate synthase family protein [Candidatus Peregrinibacteria bacterium]